MIVYSAWLRDRNGPPRKTYAEAVTDATNEGVNLVMIMQSEVVDLAGKPVEARVQYTTEDDDENT